MSLILLHRLKFPLKDDVLLLMLFTLLCSCKTSLSTAKTEMVVTTTMTTTSVATTTTSTTSSTLSSVAVTNPPPALERPGEYPIYSSHNLNNDDDDEYYANVHRILRNSERRFRNENLRWKKVATRDMMERRLFKRDTADDAIITNTTAITTIINSSSSTVATEAASANNSIASINSTKILNYSNRSIDAINFSGLAADSEQATEFSDILVLNFSHNNISIVNQSSVGPFARGLEQLDLSANRIASFECAFGMLSLLNLSCNQLEDFSSEHIRNLRTLDLSCNRLADASRLNFGYMNDVQRVDLSCNELATLTPALFGNTTNLMWLDLSCNRLTSILKQYFFNLVNVETLLLAHNNVTDIENDTFAYLPNLQYLDLAYNDIDASSIRALQGIPDLIGLSVAFNRRLGSALQGFVASWSLKELDASGTGLCQIPAALAQSVHTLNVSHNHFQTIRCGDLDSYPLLQYADLSSNEIVDIEDDALGRLEILITLRLSNNNLTAVPASLPSSLCNLFLQNNQITDILPANFVQLVNLEVLDLSGNRLTYLPGLPLPRLITLNLRESGLRGLSQSVVKTSPQLKDLLLERNPIKCTDLMGIAEWTTACRSERPNEIEMTNAEPQQTGVLHRNGKCDRRKSLTMPSFSHSTVCVSEKLSRSGTANELKSHDLLPPKNDSLSNRFADNTTETEVQHVERMNRKFGNEDGNSLNAQVERSDNNNTILAGYRQPNADDNTLLGTVRLENRVFSALPPTPTATANCSTDSTKLAAVDVKADNRTTPTNTTTTTANATITVQLQQRSDEKSTKRKWKKIAKATTTIAKAKPIKSATAPASTTSNLHGSVNPAPPINDNQTSFKLRGKTIVGNNTAALQPAPADAGKSFIRNNGAVVVGAGAKDNNATAVNALLNSNEFSSVALPLPLPLSSSQSSSLSVQRKLEKIDLTTKHRATFKAANKKQSQRQRSTAQELGHQQINPAAPFATPEDYLKDEAAAETRPLTTGGRRTAQQKLIMNGMSVTKNVGGLGGGGGGGVGSNDGGGGNGGDMVRSLIENDKSPHLADSLTQIATAPSDNHILAQTGSPDGGVIATNKQSQDNATPQGKKTARSEYQQQRTENKKIINRNTNNPIRRQQDNKSTNDDSAESQAIYFNRSGNNAKQTGGSNMRNVQRVATARTTISSRSETQQNNGAKFAIFGTKIATNKNLNTNHKTQDGKDAGAAATIVSSNMKYIINANSENVGNTNKSISCTDATQEKCKNEIAALDVAANANDADDIDKNLAITLPLADVVVSHLNGDHVALQTVRNNGVEEHNRTSVVHNSNGHTINHSITTPSSSSINPYPRHHHPPQDGIAANNRTGNEHHNNISTSTSGLPEQWNDIRTTSGHPGLFIVIGVTIGMVVSLGLIHLYRCRKPWHRRHSSHHPSGGGNAVDDDQYTPAHRDLLPMELLSSGSCSSSTSNNNKHSSHHHHNASSTIHYTDSPIELW